MNSAGAFCESPLRDRDWFESADVPDDHWYDIEPIEFASQPSVFVSHDVVYYYDPSTIFLDVEHVFTSLVEQWQADTRFVSSVDEMVLHPAYLRIVGLGSLALPFLLRDLRDTHRFWFPALAAITGENPVPSEAIGDVTRMAEHWIDWAKKNNLL